LIEWRLPSGQVQRLLSTKKAMPNGFNEKLGRDVHADAAN
jgi:hypothetical protein